MMKRYGMVIGVRPEKLDEYKRLHAAVWPEIIRLLEEAHVKNYSIFQKDALLFGYFEYHGSDLAADFARMNAEPIVKEWYAVCGPCQVPLATRKQGEWWADMDEVFHME
jgi:L-rhamnose mutarotase